MKTEIPFPHICGR